jgi:hypothetical protein
MAQSRHIGIRNDKTDLDVHRTRADVADEQEGHLLLPAGQSAHETVPEPAPEDRDPGDLEPPPIIASTGERLLDQEPVRVGVQVEPRKREDGVAAGYVGDGSAG